VAKGIILGTHCRIDIGLVYAAAQADLDGSLDRRLFLAASTGHDNGKGGK
jgi:hypothetical protein